MSSVIISNQQGVNKIVISNHYKGVKIPLPVNFNNVAKILNQLRCQNALPVVYKSISTQKNQKKAWIM